MTPVYRGRFAPSPTGPLHFGSLVAAIASFADARANSGEWMVRIEDIDRPRTVAGAADNILRTLENFGFAWDGAVVHQSEREALYRDAFDRLDRAGVLYPCGCSRKDVPEDGVYPGTCRAGLRGAIPRAHRLRVDGTIAFDDAVQGHYQENLLQQTGDFVLRRADGAWAYQLAVVVDDAAQGVTQVVRGADLLSSTPRQMYLQNLLGYPRPRYLHVPIAVDALGQKLSKQTGAQPLDWSNTSQTLSHAAAFLGHQVPVQLSVVEFWQWLVGNWRPTRIPAVQTVLWD